MLFYAKQKALLAILTTLALLVVANVWAAFRNIAIADKAVLDPRALIAMVAGLALVISLDSVIYIVNWMVGFRPFLRAFDRAFDVLFARIGFPAVIAGGVLAGIGEETFFRGILHDEIGWVPTALVFALAHVGRGFNLFALWAVLEGLIFGWLYAASGSLLAPMVVHGLHDAGGMFFARYLYKRPIPPAETLFDWLQMLSKPAPALSADEDLATADDMQTTDAETG